MVSINNVGGFNEALSLRHPVRPGHVARWLLRGGRSRHGSGRRLLPRAPAGCLRGAVLPRVLARLLPPADLPGRSDPALQHIFRQLRQSPARAQAACGSLAPTQTGVSSVTPTWSSRRRTSPRCAGFSFCFHVSTSLRDRPEFFRRTESKQSPKS